MTKKIIFGDDQIPCKGKVIIQHLDIARKTLSLLPFKIKEQQSAAQEQIQNIGATIIEVAILCSGSRHWHQLYGYLEELGIEVSQEYYLRMMYLDRVMDESPAEAKRN